MHVALGGASTRVASEGLDCSCRRAALGEVRAISVAQRMRADAWTIDACFPGDLEGGFGETPGLDAIAVFGVDDECVLLVGPDRSEGLDQVGWDRNRSRTAALEWANLPLAGLVVALEGAADSNAGVVEIDVLPAKLDDLAAT